MDCFALSLKPYPFPDTNAKYTRVVQLNDYSNAKKKLSCKISALKTSFVQLKIVITNETPKKPKTKLPCFYIGSEPKHASV